MKEVLPDDGGPIIAIFKRIFLGMGLYIYIRLLIKILIKYFLKLYKRISKLIPMKVVFNNYRSRKYSNQKLF
jgi:hypothetical protein